MVTCRPYNTTPRFDRGFTGHEHLYDFGELYLEMEDEGEKGIKGTMTEYIPVSRDAHIKRTEYLLSLLPGKAEQTLTTKDSETDIICSPNPTTGLLSLYFSLDSDSDVEISVYDMLGKVFKRILLNKQNRGSHTCDISLSDAPDGMYICMIKTSEGKTETRKIIVKH